MGLSVKVLDPVFLNTFPLDNIHTYVHILQLLKLKKKEQKNEFIYGMMFYNFTNLYNIYGKYLQFYKLLSFDAFMSQIVRVNEYLHILFRQHSLEREV